VSVSLIIATFNHARFLPVALDSALAQTLAGVEVIVVDDGSTDDTPAVLSRYTDRMRVIRQANRGLAAARNAGLAVARGTYVSFLDADDVVTPTKLAEQVALLEAAPTVGWTYCDVLIETVATGHEMRASERFGYGGRALDGWLFPELIHGNFIPAIAPLIRRTALDSAGGFDDRLTALEDWDLWLRLSLVAEARYSPAVLVRYRVHPGGMSEDRSRMDRNRFRCSTSSAARGPPPWKASGRWGGGSLPTRTTGSARKRTRAATGRRRDGGSPPRSPRCPGSGRRRCCWGSAWFAPARGSEPARRRRGRDDEERRSEHHDGHRHDRRELQHARPDRAGRRRGKEGRRRAGRARRRRGQRLERRHGAGGALCRSRGRRHGECGQSRVRRGHQPGRRRGTRDLRLRDERRRRARARVFGTLRRFLDANPMCGLAGPSLVYADGTPQPSAKRFPTLALAVGEVLGMHSVAPRNRWVRRFYYDDRDLTRDALVDTVSGAAMLLRRAAFDAVGRFDERFWMYFEETDLCRRLLARGHSVALLSRRSRDTPARRQHAGDRRAPGGLLPELRALFSQASRPGLGGAAPLCGRRGSPGAHGRPRREISAPRPPPRAEPLREGGRLRAAFARARLGRHGALGVRVLMVETGGWGGIAHYTWNLCTALAGAGVEVSLVTNRDWELAHLASPSRSTAAFPPAPAISAT
jgi:GT2 family glycosyltransferase